METQEQSHGGTDVKKTNNFDYSKAEKTIENIVIPGSRLMAKWVKEKGYGIGFENLQVTKYYDTLEKALNKVGYGTDKDAEGDDVLMKVGEVDFEIIIRIAMAVTATMLENAKIEMQNEINEVLENELGKVVKNV